MWFANLRDADVQETARSAKFLLGSKAQRLSYRAPWVPSPNLCPMLCHPKGTRQEMCVRAHLCGVHVGPQPLRGPFHFTLPGPSSVLSWSLKQEQENVDCPYKPGLLLLGK